MASRVPADGRSAFVIDAVRTPVGRRNGGVSGFHPADLAAAPVAELVRRTGVDPTSIDDVILGCLEALGPQAANIARTAALTAGLPEVVPGTTVDRQCGSSQQAVHFAAMGVLSGVQDIVIAGGVQSMSTVPMGSANAAVAGVPDPWSTSDGWRQRYGDVALDQFASADAIADKWGLSRDELESFAVRSHERALSAQETGYFDHEIMMIGDAVRDEGPRRPDLDKIRSLPPLREGGTITAAMASQISDGAAALLLASEGAVREQGLQPRARIHYMTVIGGDPILGLAATIPATARALEQSGLALSDIDLFEINEAFASVALAWIREFDVDEELVNVNGGAIALGHPLGATGARLMTTLLHELDRRKGRFGLQVMCEGGGTANLTIIESLTS